MKTSTKDAAKAYCFLLPNFMGVLLFVVGPVLASLALSFFRWDIVSWPPQFVGLDNFRMLIQDTRFWQYCGNTAFLMLGMPVGILGSLGLALLLDQKFRGMTWYKIVYFLPSITTGIGIFILWRWIYNADFGLLNWALAKIGIMGPRWLDSSVWAKPALILMGLWGGVGGTTMILYLAGLQGISSELYEAASIDGAGGWKKFRHITWPMLSPTTFFIVIMGIIGGFQGGFNAAYIMTRGGPAGSTTTVSYYIYNNAYRWLHMGYAAAIAWFLFFAVFLVTLINWKFGQKLVHYG